MPSSQPVGSHVTTAPPKAVKPSAADSKPLESKAPESKPSDSNVPEPVEPEAAAPGAKSFKEALVDGDGEKRTDSSNSTSPSSSESNSTGEGSPNTSRSNSNSNSHPPKEASDRDTEKNTMESHKREREQEQGQEKDTADIRVASKQCTVTSERLPATNVSIEKPGVARCDVVEGAPSDMLIKDFHEFTPLQQHVLFWDRDRDGQIYPYDTYRGFRDLGFNILFSFLAVLIINLNFSYPTRLAHSFFPDPRFRVYVGSIYKAKHGSDSGTFDAEGRFVPQHFEDMFAKYDGDKDGALTFGELFDMMHGNRCAADPFGWGAAFFEWITTWLLIQKEGKIYKDDLLGVYDGSLFWKIAKARKSREGWYQGFGLGGDGFVGGIKMI
ncbi:Caleosin related protein-domain-containing protein [Aspergillus recurvatus]